MVETTRRSLSPEDWLLVGQELLRRDGFAGVKLAALTRSAGVTTGSFYHHFADMDDYLTRLATHYGGAQMEETLRAVADQDPLVRLRRFARLFDERNIAPLDRAMRTWARFRPEARLAMRRADRFALGFLTEAFTDLGLPAPGARLRARMLLSLGVADISVAWRSADGVIEEVLRILLADAP